MIRRYLSSPNAKLSKPSTFSSGSSSLKSLFPSHAKSYQVATVAFLSKLILQPMAPHSRSASIGQTSYGYNHVNFLSLARKSNSVCVIASCCFRNFTILVSTWLMTILDFRISSVSRSRIRYAYLSGFYR